MGFERAVEVKLRESIVIYTLAVFFPWVAFSLRDRIFSTVFSFILWIIFGYNIFAFVFSGGGVFGISLILESFFFVGNIDHLVLFGHAWGSKTKGNGTTY
ncbi:flagellar biosynthesis protein FlgG [Helicobacter pylori]|nr:flagellar biosynthesis protein FlgG [Helicobacter pylori]RKV34429.1 flagellar biosynthesis protein FlgG [Helicobacter pylori]